MSNDKEIINKLIKVVAQQQQIITKIAQQIGAPAPATDNMKASVEADIYDIIYGRNAKPQFGPKIQVHYAKVQQISGGANLLVGLTIPETLMSKWEASKNVIETGLKNKYNVTSVVFRQ